MRIQTKLVTGFLAVAILVGLLGLIAQGATKEVDESLERLTQVDFPAISALNDIRASTNSIIHSSMQYALIGDEKFKEEYFESKSDYAASLQKYAAAERGEEEFIKELSRVTASIIARSDELVKLKDSGAPREVLINRIVLLDEAEKELASLLEKEIAHDNEELAEAQLWVDGKIEESLYFTGLASIFVVLLAILLGYYFSRSISNPIIELKEAAERVSKGDLEVEIKKTGQDEVGELAASFKLMVEELRKSRDTLEDEVKKQTKELVTTLDYLNRLIDTSPIAIITTDLEGKITSFNEHAEKMYGYKEGEVVGAHAKILQPSEVSEEKGRRVIAVVLKGGVWERDILQRKKDGEVFQAHLRVRRLLDEKRQPIGMLSLALDVTGRVKAREQLESYARQLDETNRLKELFTDILRHDLLNPVSVIKGVSLLGAEEAKGKAKKNLEIISKNAAKLEDLIEAAAKLSRIESEKELLLVEVDLNESIRSAAEGLKPAMEEKKMKLEFMDESKYLVRANPILEEAFYNLISNAVKYSPAKTKITLGVEDQGTHWQVSVRDEGEGVPDEFKKAIFERFERGGKRGVKGTGLGLAIVKRIVDLHNGEVWVEDNSPRGSAFKVRLPKQ